MSAPLTLPEVAAKRGWQQLAQGLAIDVVVAVALVLLAALGDVQRWEDFVAPALTLAVGKSVVQAVCAWVIRRWFDRSGFAADDAPDATPRPVGD